MKRILPLLLIFWTAALIGQTSTDDDVKCSVAFSSGNRKDHLKWYISGPNKSPNVFSELTFKDLKIHIHTLTLNLSKNGYFLEGIRSWGDVKSGKIKDADYLKSDRKDEFSRSYSKATGKNVNDTTILAGKTWIYNPSLQGSLLTGYTCMQERIRMQDGYQTKQYDIFRMSSYSTNRKIHHLDSSYRARWEAPLVGGRASWKPFSRLTLRGECHYLFCVKYFGRGYWNLRQKQFDGSFRHETDRVKGHGYMLSGGAAFEIFKNCTLTADTAYTKLRAKGGHDKIDTRMDYQIKLPFGKATLRSTMWRFGLEYTF